MFLRVRDSKVWNYFVYSHGPVVYKRKVVTGGRQRIVYLEMRMLMDRMPRFGIVGMRFSGILYHTVPSSLPHLGSPC